MSREQRFRVIGWGALAIAVSAALLVVLRLFRLFDVYCDWSKPCDGLLLAAIPANAAMLTMALGAIALSLRLKGAAPTRSLSFVCLATALVASAALVIGIIALYDQLLAMASVTSALDAPPQRPPALPPRILVVATEIWPPLYGAWVILTALALSTLGLARPYTVVGIGAGFALMASTAVGATLAEGMTLALALLVVWTAAVSRRLIRHLGPTTAAT
jgi:hypothetical protein